MPKLPSIESFGGRPTPGVQGPSQIRKPELPDIGGGISAIGEAFAKIQYQDDKLRAEDGINKLQQKKLDLTNGDEGFQRIKSGDVVQRPLYKEFIEQFDKQTEEITGGLANDQQRSFFRRRAEVLKLQYGSDLTNHIQREKDAHAEQVFKGGKAVELQNAAAHWNEPESVKFSLERSKRLIEQQGEREGWSKDILKAQKIAATSDIHESVINQAVSTDNPEYAREWFKKNKKDIDSTQYPKIESLIREGGIKVLAQEVTDDIAARGLDEKSALAEVRKKYKGDEENAILASVRNRFNEADQIKDDNETKFSETAWSIYGETRDINKVPLDILRGMKGKDRTILEDKAKLDLAGKDVPNGGPDYYKLKLLARDNPNAFQKINPFAYSLSETDRKEIIKNQTDEDKANLFGSDTLIVDEAAVEAGLNPKDKFDDSDSGKEVRAFHERIRSEQAQYKARTGKEPDDKTLSDIVDRLTIKVVKEKKAIFDWMNPKSFPTWLTDPIFSPAETPVAIAEIEGVPTEMIDELSKAIRDAGQPVTENNVKLLYTHLYGK